MSKLLEKYPDLVEAILAKYPMDQKRSAVMPLIYLAQHEGVRESGKLMASEESIQDIADLLELDPTEVGSIVGFYSLYYDQPESRYRIQVCTDLPCALRGADRFLDELCKRLNIKPGETTADDLFTVEAVMCLAACDRAPMFQVQSGDGLTYHENQTVESAMALIELLRQEASSKNQAGFASALAHK